MIQILLVEDDPVLGRGLKVTFELGGYAVRWEPALKSAAQGRAQGKCDLVVLDLGLPDGNGLKLLKEIRSAKDPADARLPVVILTAQADEDSVVEGLQSGANDYVRKP